jgi:hypothetical protein
MADRHCLGDILGDDVLAQPCPPGFGLLGAYMQPLLRAGHRTISGRPGGVAPFDAWLASQVLTSAPRVLLLALVLGALAAGLLGAVPEISGVVVIQRVVLRLTDVTVRLDAGSAFDHDLGHSELQGVPVGAGSIQRGEAFLRAKHAGGDRDPQRLAGLVIDVDLPDLAELGPLDVDGGPALHVLQVLGGSHAWAPSV